MDKDRFHPLSTSREPNPLRPYYIPPSINHAPNASSSQIPHAARPTTSSSSFSTSARDLLPELDIDLKSTTSEAWQQTRSLLDTLVWRYSSVLLAQPFDVSKTLLQVALPPGDTASATAKKRRISPRQSYSNGRAASPYDLTSDSDLSDRESDDIPDYFTSAAPRSRSPRKRRRTPPTTSLSPTPTPKDRREHDPDSTYKLRLKSASSITQTISALYNTSGAVGLWRATNCTFIYTILSRTTDSFLRSLLLALVGLPEIIGPDGSGLAPALTVPGAAGFSGLDVSQSPNPVGSLVVIGIASCLTGLLLAPLDLVRTRLIVAPTFHGPRGLLQNIRRLPSLVAPSSLWLPTALYHTLPQTFSAAAPLFLRRQLRITPEMTPSLWSLASFTTALTDLFLRLPFETILRRAQVTSLRAGELDLPTVVEVTSYDGVWGTVYSILYTEGEIKGKDGRLRRGQGVGGLVRGWRIGFWGLVGVWGGGALGPGEGKGRGEF